VLEPVGVAFHHMANPPVVTRARRGGATVFWAYARTLLYEFRWTILATTLAVGLAAVLFAITPQTALGGRRPDVLTSLFGGWSALFGQPLYSPPDTWYLVILHSVYPLLGVLLIGEGIVHLGMLMVSRRRGEKEWMRVMASTFKNHVVLCGMGRLGIRVLEQLLQQGREVVVVEKDESSSYVVQARATGVPVLIRDMTEDQALIDAGVPAATAIIVATNNDVANLEVALDARRMNPKIHVSVRLFDQRVAEKLQQVFTIDHAFSASALAAPAVAGMALGVKVLSTCRIGGVAHVAAEVRVAPGSALVGQRVGELETAHGVRLLARTPEGASVESPPVAATQVAPADVLVVHAPLAGLDRLTAAAAAP
jgi:voltage-gated potassium channel